MSSHPMESTHNIDNATNEVSNRTAQMHARFPVLTVLPHFNTTLASPATISDLPLGIGPNKSPSVYVVHYAMTAD